MGLGCFLGRPSSARVTHDSPLPVILWPSRWSRAGAGILRFNVPGVVQRLLSRGRETKVCRGPLPVVVGVTGHRDLRRADVQTLEKLVRSIFVELNQKYPHTPLLLLSPLAEGADRLVARVAREVGASLFVPLPLPRSLYETDFQGGDSRSEFRSLLASADGIFELPLLSGNTMDAISKLGMQRNRQYAQVGAFIAQRSQVFLSLWNGVYADGEDRVGGTADVVRFRLDGVPLGYDSAASPLNAASNGSVYHIVTPRDGESVPDHALTLRRLTPSGQTVSSADDLHRWTDHFNQDAVSQGLDLIEGKKRSKAQLLRVSTGELEGEELRLLPAARIALDYYALADCLALHFGALTRAAARRLFGWVFVAAMGFNVFHSLPHPHIPATPTLFERLLGVPWPLVVFLVASLVASLWVYRRTDEAGHQNRHQDYRALAEALRVQFFWRAAGISDNAVDHYLRKQRGALDWIRNALRACDIQAQGQPITQSATTSGRGLAVAAEQWVAEQQEYYGSRARREQVKLEKAERTVRLLALLSVGLALSLAVFLTAPLVIRSEILEAVKHAIEAPWTHGAIMLSIVGFGVTAGLLHGYNQQMARAEHTRQFTRMSELFYNARQPLDALLQSGDHTQARELLKELGEEALEENGDWVLLHRDRPLEVPHSG